MKTHHLSEAEAQRNFAGLLECLRNGDEVFIGEGEDALAIIASPAPPAIGEDPEYDAWVIRETQKALDSSEPGLSSEEAQEIFLAHKARALREREVGAAA